MARPRRRPAREPPQRQRRWRSWRLHGGCFCPSLLCFGRRVAAPTPTPRTWRQIRGTVERTPVDDGFTPRKVFFLRGWRGHRPPPPLLEPETSLHWAAQIGYGDLVRQLLREPLWDVDLRDEQGRTALHFACWYHNMEIVTLLVENHCQINVLDRNNATPLIMAAQSGQEEIVDFLLKHGADPNISDMGKNSPLHYSVYFGTPAIVTSLLVYRANIEEETPDGFTPLLLALREQKLEIAELLITMNADVDACDLYRRNSLIYAVRCDSEDLVNLLLQQNVNFYSEDNTGWIALRYAVEGECKVRRRLLAYEQMLLQSLEKHHPETKHLGDLSLARRNIRSQYERKLLRAAQSEYQGRAAKSVERKESSMRLLIGRHNQNKAVGRKRKRRGVIFNSSSIQLPLIISETEFEGTACDVESSCHEFEHIQLPSTSEHVRLCGDCQLCGTERGGNEYREQIKGPDLMSVSEEDEDIPLPISKNVREETIVEAKSKLEKTPDGDPTKDEGNETIHPVTISEQVPLMGDVQLFAEERKENDCSGQRKEPDLELISLSDEDENIPLPITSEKIKEESFVEEKSILENTPDGDPTKDEGNETIHPVTISEQVPLMGDVQLFAEERKENDCSGQRKEPDLELISLSDEDENIPLPITSEKIKEESFVEEKSKLENTPDGDPTNDEGNETIHPVTISEQVPLMGDVQLFAEERKENDCSGQRKEPDLELISLSDEDENIPLPITSEKIKEESFVEEKSDAEKTPDGEPEKKESMSEHVPLEHGGQLSGEESGKNENSQQIKAEADIEEITEEDPKSPVTHSSQHTRPWIRALRKRLRACARRCFCCCVSGDEEEKRE